MKIGIQTIWMKGPLRYGWRMSMVNKARAV